jgi:hypothetical protein
LPNSSTAQAIWTAKAIAVGSPDGLTDRLRAQGAAVAASHLSSQVIRGNSPVRVK